MRCAPLLLVLCAACSGERAPAPASLSVGELLSAPADPRFERALAPRELAFPADHGPHPSFQTEWWYFTGNLDDEQGGELAYQLTFFRRALEFEPPSGGSAWRARDAWMAHLTVADVRSGAFRARERFERGALGLAGAQGAPWRVWLRDWRADGELDGGELHLVARDEGLALDLTLRAAGPPVLHGERGLSRKGREPGSASYYYSIPRLETRGTLALDGRAHAVRGASWYDREWSTSVLEPGQIGWDWFGLRLEDGAALMLFRMRRDDRSADPCSGGTYVAPDGARASIAAADFALDELARWTSPASSASYPARWRIRVREPALELEFAASLPDCELPLSVRYWEGPVRGAGVRGFAELTGY